jgi:AbrB family looped-hinge helix DNA binding protein
MGYNKSKTRLTLTYFPKEVVFKLRSVVKVSSKGQIVLPARLREKAAIKKGDVLAVSLVGNKVIIEPLARPTKENWRQVLEETAGIWSEVDPGYVDELRAAVQQRLEETP